MTRLHCEALETRENPTGPGIVDPIGIPVVIAPPTVESVVVAPSTPTATETAVVQQIIQNTLAALTTGW